MPNDSLAPEKSIIEGKEQKIIESLIGTFYPLAKSGDKDAADKIIKLLQLRRLYKQDKAMEDLR